MMSAKFSDLLTPSPFVTVTKSADFVPFVCFLGTPSPHQLRTSCMEAPLGVYLRASNIENDLSEQRAIIAPAAPWASLGRQDGPDGLLEHRVQPFARLGRALHLQVCRCASSGKKNN